MHVCVCVYVYTTPWLSAFTSTLFETESLAVHLCIPQANWSKSLQKILLIPSSLSEHEDYRLAPSCWAFLCSGNSDSSSYVHTASTLPTKLSSQLLFLL